MDDCCRLGAASGKSVHVSHDVMTPLFLLHGGTFKVYDFQISSHFTKLLFSDV
jgi:hypothetical protein